MNTNNVILDKMISNIISSDTRGIIDNTKYDAMQLSMDIINEDKVISPRKISNITYEHDVTNISEIVDATITVSVKDYITIQRNIKDLNCIVKCKYINHDNIHLNIDTVIPKKYKMYLHDDEDIMMGTNYKDHLSTEDDVLIDQVDDSRHTSYEIEIRVQLIDEDVYHLRKKYINTILRDTTIHNVLRYTAYVFGISNVVIEVPDNEKVYETITIPPEYGKFTKIYDYLQDRYGIYSDGLIYYYTNDTLYVYGKNNTRISNKNINIIHGKENMGMGISNLYKFKDVTDQGRYGTIDILNINEVSTRNLNTYSSENDHDVAICYPHSRIYEGVDNSNKDNITIRKDNILRISSDDDGGLDNKSIHARYKYGVSNLYKITSDMISGNFDINTYTIDNMLVHTHESLNPYPIIPGDKVVLIYDTDESIKERHGIVDGIIYHVESVEATSLGVMHICKVVMSVRIDTSTKVYETKHIK